MPATLINKKKVLIFIYTTIKYHYFSKLLKSHTWKNNTEKKNFANEWHTFALREKVDKKGQQLWAAQHRQTINWVIKKEKRQHPFLTDFFLPSANIFT